MANSSALTAAHLFYLVAIETLGPLSESAPDFISDIGRRATIITSDPRETTSFLYQRIPMAIQRTNAVCDANTSIFEPHRDIPDIFANFSNF